MPTKTKLPQKEQFSGRDMFRTPRYAVNILHPYLKRASIKRIWECAAGDGNIVYPLLQYGYSVYATDIRNTMCTDSVGDFLNLYSWTNEYTYAQAIVTNPPFSLKKKFAEMCVITHIPFALLIPADYSGWIIEMMQNGCEKIIPTRRVDYLTPNMLSNINKSGVISEYYRLEDVPTCILRNYTSNFHSMWLTWGLNIGKQETYVELTNEMKNNIF